MKRKKELIVVLTSLLVIVLSVSVAYFATKILGTGKDVSVTSADLRVTFTSGSGTISGSDIEPGWSSGENTFTVKNETNGTYSYNIIIKDLVNTFVTTGFLQYKITSTDGGYNMTDFADVPKASTAYNAVIAQEISIAKNATHTYKIEFKYSNSDTVDQSDDMGQTLSGKIFIQKYETTLTSKLLENNPTISERTDFSTAFTTNTVNTLYKATENGTDVYYFAGVDNIDGRCEYNGQSIYENGKLNLLMEEDKCISGMQVCKSDDNYLIYGVASSCSGAYDGSNITLTNVTWITGAEKPINNWVKFGGFYWRIIRTNADKSVKLLYSGTSPDTTKGYIGTSVFNTNNMSPKYVGYMYGDSDTTLEEARTNTNDSTIKTYIDNWYENNLITYTNYLSNDAIYCNDRELASGGSYPTTASRLYFKSYERIATNKVPSYDCTNTKDAFSGNNTAAKLKYPISLMTADEISYAGGIGNANSPMWYYTNNNHNSIIGSADWWLLSSYDKYGSIYFSYIVASSYLQGVLTDGNVASSKYVRPVTSLKSCVQWKSGDGSAESPYEIVENGGC